jgi:predicted metal-binding membrane protein
LWLATLIFLGTWGFMLIAMMGPCVQNQLGVVVRVSRPRGWRAWTLQLPFLLGYGLVWSVFGLVAFGLDLGRLHLAAQWSWLAAHAWVIGVGLITLATLYQFTPWKWRAVKDCGVRCDPERVARAGGAWRAGLHVGGTSLRSDEALMLIMFGVGMTNLVWLVALTLVMVAEHLAPWRLRVVSLAGVSLALVAILWGTQATTAQAASDGAAQSHLVGTTLVSLYVTPAGYGPNTVQVTLTEHQQPIIAQHATLTLTMLDMDMGQQSLLLQPQTTGVYTAAATLSMPGRWQLTLTADTPADHLTTSFVILADRYHTP